MSKYRLAEGGRIDRSRPISFRFEGHPFQGFQGDTLASALIAHGVHIVGRSFKYHRPRGFLAAGSDEPNALVEVRRDAARITPNQRATIVELYDGLDARSQNRWPSLLFDVGSFNDVVSPLLPAGFYYKTFMWPRGAWHKFYEPLIRRAAGLGRAPELPDPDHYATRFAHADVLVVGAGPAGLAAALAAAESGARVMLCDEQPEFGGSLLAPDGARIDGLDAEIWRRRTVARLAALGVALLPRTTAFGYFPHNMVALCERVTDHLPAPDPLLPRERLWQVRAGVVVLATGAIERPMVFRGNDRPGVMLADAARTYAQRYAAKPGQVAVVAAAHDTAYAAALALHRVGVRIAVIADSRARASGPWPAMAQAAGIKLRWDTHVARTTGRFRVSSATLAGPSGKSETVSCNLLIMSGGWTPNVHLFSQSKGKLRFDDALAAYVPDAPVERTRCAGACRGLAGLRAVLEDGYAAGAQAAADTGFGKRAHTVPEADGHAGLEGGALPTGPAPKGRAFVDFQNDVTAKDLMLAAREGFRSIEHVKRYTTTGMATDQGKTSNMNALGIVAGALAMSVPDVGHTTFRMPYTPVTFGTLAGLSRGPLFDPVRTTPIHVRAEAEGAVFEDVGAWKRARYFPRGSEDMHAAVARECRAVREGVGAFDASTLGKIEVCGADAAEFLHRMYVNDVHKIAVGRARYAVLLREDGFVLDDGIIARLAPDRFHVTTTTGNAARVLAMMEDYRQTEWAHLDVWLTSVTEQWAVVAIQGPRAREVLAELTTDADVAAGAMPHMTVREGRFCGVPARLFRVSFTGELGYEVNVPADYGADVWEAVLARGATPYGTETMHVLRAEKGYIIVGQETDGTATPDDVGLSWAIGKGKADFVGLRSLRRPALSAEGRKQLVGLLPDDPAEVLVEGAQLVPADASGHPGSAPLGHVTSAYHSAVLGRGFALAMVANGRARIGATLAVPMPGGARRVKVTAPVFVDPEGKRLHV